MVLLGCGGEKKTTPKLPVEKSEAEKNWQTNKGVGPISSITLTDIDVTMVQKGEKLFKNKCVACHKTTASRLIGPGLGNVIKRRTPEWIMNMILDPKLMTEQDRCAKDLLIEFNGAAMSNQNLTVEQTRSILEYFRTL